MASTFSLPRERRLRQQSHFDQLFKTARRIEGRYFRIYLAPKKFDLCCWGVVTSKKIGNAVIRNRVKRRFKAIIRLHQHQVSQQVDMVFVAKPQAKEATYKQFEMDIIETFKQRKLLNDYEKLTTIIH